MLWPGVPPTVVFSEKPGAPQKSYHPDEKIGDWKIDFIDRSYVVLEWNGKQFKKAIDELVEKNPVVAAAQPAAAAARPGQGPPASLSVIMAPPPAPPAPPVSPPINRPAQAWTLAAVFERVSRATPLLRERSSAE